MNALRLGEGRHLHLGGNYFHVQNLARSVAVTGEVELLLLTDEHSHVPLAAAVPGARMIKVLSKGGGVLQADWATLRACREFRPDIYHRPTGQLPFMRLPCRTVASIADLNFRILPTPCLKRIYKEFSYRWTVRVADRITCVSEFTKQEVVRRLRVDPRRLKVIHHGTNELAPADGSLADSFDVPFWLTFGHQRHKNVETCLRALRIKKDESAALSEKLVIVGRSAYLDEVVRPEVARLGVTDRVEFVGHVSEASLRGLYEKALGLLFLSRYEGFGLPVLEAMGCGCPVISSTACSLPEVAGPAALLLDPDDAAGVATAMRSLVDNQSRRCALIQAGRERAAEFTWRRAAQETIAVYKALQADVK